MGKTCKGKDKAKAKTARARRKAVRKCKCCCALVVLLGMLCGCTTSDSAQPAKSQSQYNSLHHCIIVAAARCSISNRVVAADGTTDMPALEIFTQTQSLESTGSTETISPAATQTPTTDIKPQIDARYNDALAAASNASRSVLGAIGDGLTGVLELMQSGKSGIVRVTKTDGTAATVKCENGQCSYCPDCSY